MKQFQYVSQELTLALDRDRCTGCGVCTEVCPHQVFSLNGRKAVFVCREECMECGACALNCPARAITVDSGVGCASGMINRWLARFTIKQTGNDACC